MGMIRPESGEAHQAEIAELRDRTNWMNEIILKQRAEIDRLTAERANRYWEGRWRDEKADNERLHELLRTMVKDEPDTPLGVYFNDIEAALERARHA